MQSGRLLARDLAEAQNYAQFVRADLKGEGIESAQGGENSGQ
jgi:hypothetical protein